jgi:hypothetical protein
LVEPGFELGEIEVFFAGHGEAPGKSVIARGGGPDRGEQAPGRTGPG